MRYRPRQTDSVYLLQPAGTRSANCQKGSCDEQIAKKLSRYDAIIVDDIGYVQQSRQEMEVLFTFLADRYERGSLMITSNLPFSKWQRIFKDPINAAVAIDRLVHHSKIVELNIESYRMQVAKKNKGKKPDGPAKGSKSVGFG